jgi:hypothetical protein
MQLARRKLAKKTHPNHGGRRRPTTAIVPHSRHRRIQTSNDMLRDKSVVKTRQYNCFYNLLAIQRHGALSTRGAWCGSLITHRHVENPQAKSEEGYSRVLRSSP